MFLLKPKNKRQQENLCILLMEVLLKGTVKIHSSISLGKNVNQVDNVTTTLQLKNTVFLSVVNLTLMLI